MKRVLFALLVLAPLWLSSCQCSDKPDIGPVEEEASTVAARAYGMA